MTLQYKKFYNEVFIPHNLTLRELILSFFSECLSVLNWSASFFFQEEIIITKLLVAIPAWFSRVAIPALEALARDYAQLRVASR